MNNFLKFRVKLEDEDFLIYKDIGIKPNVSVHSFIEFILSSFNFDNTKDMELFKCNSEGGRTLEIEINKSIVLNKFIDSPSQRFIFRYDSEKLWTFPIQLIGIEETNNKLPFVINSKGLVPSQYSAAELNKLKKINHTQKLFIKSSIR